MNIEQTVVSGLRLGLIGAGIGRSLTPFLQEQMGAQFGLETSYELFDTPAQQGHTLAAKLEQLRSLGYSGVNVTFPFKELAFGLVQVNDPMVRRIGAINTVRFRDGQGFNTDYSGFIRAYRHVRGPTPPGKVLLVGAGGAGKAVAFALVTLGVDELRITDTDFDKAQALAEGLRQATANAQAFPIEQLPEISHCDGLINCTPLGMYQFPGNPILPALVDRQNWAFDAIYTPLETEFLQDARQKKLTVIRGSELMFYQAVDAFEIWTGHQPVEEQLYALLQEQLSNR